jgi:hypothetical protein
MPFSRLPLRKTVGIVSDAAKAIEFADFYSTPLCQISIAGEAINKALGRQFSGRFIDGLDKTFRQALVILGNHRLRETHFRMRAN